MKDKHKRDNQKAPTRSKAKESGLDPIRENIPCNGLIDSIRLIGINEWETVAIVYEYQDNEKDIS